MYLAQIHILLLFLFLDIPILIVIQVHGGGTGWRGVLFNAVLAIVDEFLPLVPGLLLGRPGNELLQCYVFC